MTTNNPPFDSDAVDRRRNAAWQREVAAVLRSATEAGEHAQADLFSSEEEKIIQNGLTRLFYKRWLPHGGDREMDLADKMMRLANMGGPSDGSDAASPYQNKGLKGIPGLGVAVLAEQYRKTKGWYYILKPLSDFTTSQWMKRMAAEWAKPELDRNYDLIWFCERRLEGIPTLVANFRMTCFFTLLRADGLRDRVVEIVTERGERSGKIRLSAEDLGSLRSRTGFGVWLSNHSNGFWLEGEKALQMLEADMKHDAAFKNVHEVTAIGHHDPSGLWLMGDCAFGPGGELKPDEDGVYWHEGIGYMLGEMGSENQPFAQKRPLMHPGKVLIEDKEADPGGEIVWKLVEEGSAGASPQEEAEAVNLLFGEMACRVRDSLGGFDGYLVVGAFLAFIGRPEFFAAEGCFPGLMLHGETNHGKSSMMRWMMELFGFHKMSEGVSLAGTSTMVGMQVLLEQYSSLPGWLSDFSNDVDRAKQDMMHAAYNAGVTLKFTMGGQSRKMRTMYVVDGESRPSKGSTRFRYMHILVSRSHRRGNYVKWFEKNRRFFLPWRGRSCAVGRSSPK